MKVFLVSLILLVLVAALFFMVSSQNTIAPIVYLTRPINDENYPRNFNFEVMDVTTGDIIFEGSTEEHDCPYEISPDGLWLSYGIGYASEAEYHRLNLQTLEDEITEETNSEYRDGARAYQAGNALVYVRANLEENQLIIYLPDGQSTSVDFDTENLTIVNFSNDARFMLYYRYTFGSPEPSLYLLDTSNGEIQELVDSQYAAGGTWHPITNQLLYHAETRVERSGEWYLALYDPITKEYQRLTRYSYGFEYVNYYWSPDGKNLAIDVNLGLVSHADSNYVFVLNLERNELIQAASFTNDYLISFESGVLRWTSPTEFAYIATNLSGYGPYEVDSDVFLYNVENQTSRNLTNTPEIIKFKRCTWG
jgi:hypothetical protein